MTISVTRQLPVINGYVSIPDGQIMSPTSLTPADVATLIPGAKLHRISPHSGVALTIDTMNSDQALRAKGAQFYIELPAYDAPGGPGTDYFKVLRDAAS